MENQAFRKVFGGNPGHPPSTDHDLRDQSRTDTMPETVPRSRYGVSMLAALAGLAMVVVTVGKALGQKPSTPVTVVNPQLPVTVDNPATNPVPTSVVNPATMPALTSSVDDPGRIPYQRAQQPATVCDNVGACVFNFPKVPAGHRLVIQHISGSLGLANDPRIVILPVGVSLNSSQASIFFLGQCTGLAGFNFINCLFDQSVLLCRCRNCPECIGVW
jgi:hypothetical protein